MSKIIDEGYIKFNCNWQKEACLSFAEIAALNDWRDRLYAFNLLGVYDNGIGFGNVSARFGESQLIISGTQTGSVAQLDERHYALVNDYDIDKNEVYCKGLIKASSETMSHAVIYKSLPNVQAVFHVHHLDLWKKHLHKIPTTAEHVAYGTPEMGYEIIRLIKETDVRNSRCFAMAGHEEGLMFFGESLEAAGRVVLDFFA